MFDFQATYDVFCRCYRDPLNQVVTSHFENLTEVPRRIIVLCHCCQNMRALKEEKRVRHP